MGEVKMLDPTLNFVQF